MTRLVIVGGALAGHRAAVHARRIDPELDITVLGAEDELPYQRPPLSKGFLTGDVPENRVRLRGAGEGYRLLTPAPAVGLDLTRSEVVLEGAKEPFDLLVVATGAHPRILGKFPPGDQVIYLRTLKDAIRLRDALGHNRHLTIIGGGFVGAEVAMSARHRGVDVVLVEQSQHLLSRAVGSRVSRIVETHLQDNGVTLALGREVTQEFAGTQRLISDGVTTWSTDLIVIGVGVVPSTEWLDDALPTRDDGGIAVTEFGLVAGFEQIAAVGDVASWYHPLYGRPLRFEHFEVATNQAQHAVETLLGRGNTPYQELPFGWSDQGGLLIQFLGVPQSDLIEEEESAEDGRLFLYRRNERTEGAILLNATDELTAVRERLISTLMS